MKQKQILTLFYFNDGDIRNNIPSGESYLSTYKTNANAKKTLLTRQTRQTRQTRYEKTVKAKKIDEKDKTDKKDKTEKAD